MCVGGDEKVIEWGTYWPWYDIPVMGKNKCTSILLMCNYSILFIPKQTFKNMNQ